MIQRYKQQGFTLIELMLAMTFVGILLLVIAMTSLNIMKTYNKGVTVREVNQVGRLVTDDIQRTIAASPPFSVEPKTGAANDPIGSRYVEMTEGGRLCTGAFTYAWNYGMTKELSGNEAMPSVYNTYLDSDEKIRLVKVSDTGGLLCANMTAQIPKAQAKELLQAGDRNLAVHAFSVSAQNEGRDDASGQALYAIDLTLGTNNDEDNTILNPTNTACLAPKQSENGEEASDGEDFCAINQFSIIARAGNRAGSI